MAATTVPITTPSTTPPTDIELTSYQWVVGALIMIAVLLLASKTKAGYALIYYSLALMIVFLMVTQYNFIAEALAPVGFAPPDSGKK